MDLGTILICVVLLAALAIAVVLFIRSPDEGKFNGFTPAHKPEVEYAPEYTAKEKIFKLSIHLLWLLPLFLLFNHVLAPALSEPTDWACADWLGWPAVRWVLLLLVCSPMLLLTAAMAPVVAHWLRVKRHQQHPLPGQKVFKPTPVIRGDKALNRARMVLIVLPVCWLILLVMSIGLAARLDDLVSAGQIDRFCQSASLSVSAG